MYIFTYNSDLFVSQVCDYDLQGRATLITVSFITTLLLLHSTFKWGRKLKFPKNNDRNGGTKNMIFLLH